MAYVNTRFYLCYNKACHEFHSRLSVTLMTDSIQNVLIRLESLLQGHYTYLYLYKMPAFFMIEYY